MEKKKLNRREFLKYTSAGLAGGYVTLKTGSLLARMGGGGGADVVAVVEASSIHLRELLLETR